MLNYIQKTGMAKEKQIEDDIWVNIEHYRCAYIWFFTKPIDRNVTSRIKVHPQV